MMMMNKLDGDGDDAAADDDDGYDGHSAVPFFVEEDRMLRDDGGCGYYSDRFALRCDDDGGCFVLA